jgi:hypothetical protein
MKKLLTLVFSFSAFLSFGQLTSSLHYSLGLPVVHAHKVAEVFTSRLRLLDIKVGYYVQF